MQSRSKGFIGALRTLVLAIRLALPKIGVGWMFALLSSNFNRVTMVELGVTAILVTTLIGMHNFLSPFQMIFGRMADRRPILGLRRTPYMLAGGLITSLVFVALPTVAQGMGRGEASFVALGFGLLLLFGIAQATLGDAHHSLIAESVDSKRRGGVVSVVWTFTILSAIISAGVFKTMMPTYTPESMQALYSLTPFVVLGSMLLGVIGIERRLSRVEMNELIARGDAAVPAQNALAAAMTLLRTNPQVRAFFAFVALSIMAIFMQDAILEVFGAEIFGMTLKETTSFTQIWGGGVLLGMLGMGVLSSFLPISKKLIAMIGGGGTALGLGLLTLCALSGQRALLNPALIMMGVFTGFFNVGALSLMMEMTVEGATGLYMGMWGTAQALGNGSASLVSGGLRSALIETGLLTPQLGYTMIFGIETVMMVVGIAALSTVSLAAFQGLTRRDLTTALEAGVVAS